MQVHHINCGSLRVIDPVIPGEEPLPAVCHCLLVETDTGDLVLVETGIGTADIADPIHRLGAAWVEMVQPALAEDETAVAHLRRLGHQPQDVRDIVLTHLDLDHAGGLTDFPDARVHVHEAEHRAATTASGRLLTRYRPPQWAHQPRWQPHPDTSGEHWFGFEAVRDIDGLANTIVLIPLAGHTRGHTGIAVDLGDRWLLHAGDAFYYHGELNQPPRPHPVMQFLAEANETDRHQRISNLERLRHLHHDTATIDIFAAHDPWTLQHHLRGGNASASSTETPAGCR
jgi:glyoxylase-like metal-dependent hydrolase (beta-lactamase superfamily II)